MRLLIDILHPAHVHFFRPLREEMTSRGHDVDVTAREKEMTTDLLRTYGIEHDVLSHQARQKLGLGLELASRTLRLIRLAHQRRPDVLAGIMGPSIALAGRLLGIPSVVFYDTEHARHTNSFVYPLAHTVCTPDCYEGKVPGRHVSYPGYHELAYLHPSRFTPNPDVLQSFGLSKDEPFFLVRFVSWQSIHDLGRQGLTLEDKVRIVELLERKGRVVVSTEGDVPPTMEGRVLRGRPESIHHVIAHARGLIGESATMCSEAAVLGVPSVFVSPLRLGYLQEQERVYGLVQNVDPSRSNELMEVVESLPWPGTREGHRRLLEEKIDVTAWLVQFFESMASDPPS